MQLIAVINLQECCKARFPIAVDCFLPQTGLTPVAQRCQGQKQPKHYCENEHFGPAQKTQPLTRDSREYGENADPAKRSKGGILLIRSLKYSELGARVRRRNPGDDYDYQDHEAEDCRSPAETGPGKTQKRKKHGGAEHDGTKYTR